MNKIENKEKLQGCFEKLYGRAQESRGREGKKKWSLKPNRSSVFYMHHKGEIEMNLMTPRNGVFACQNQLHMMYKYGRAGDALTRAQHTTTIFLNPFNLLKKQN
jgi:hypothetical protein